MLEYDYSLIASCALFIACNLTKHNVDSTLLSNNKSFLNVHPVQEFVECLDQMKNSWKLMRTTTAYANFEAVYNKYFAKHQLNAKNLADPQYTQTQVNGWFYTKS